MLDKRTTIETWVTCDECGEQAPKGLSSLEARILALEAGFEQSTLWNGLKHVSTDLCPACRTTGQANSSA